MGLPWLVRKVDLLRTILNHLGLPDLMPLLSWVLPEAQWHVFAHTRPGLSRVLLTDAAVDRRTDILRAARQVVLANNVLYSRTRARRHEH